MTTHIIEVDHYPAHDRLQTDVLIGDLTHRFAGASLEVGRQDGDSWLPTHIYAAGSWTKVRYHRSEGEVDAWVRANPEGARQLREAYDATRQRQD